MDRTKLVLFLGLLLGLLSAASAGAANPLIPASAILRGPAMDALTTASLTDAPSAAADESTSKLKEKILSVPTGTMIEVKLLNKEKVRGRLGKVDDQGFSLTTSEQGKIVTRTLAFNEVSSVKQVEGGKGGSKLIWMLAGIGAFVAILAIVAATQL